MALQATGGGVSLNRTLGDAAETEPPAVEAIDGTPGAIRIGRFLILKMLGRGSMGVVYAAYDETLDRRVALKVIRRDVSWRSSVRRRTVREAQALAKLSHRNVVQVYDVGELDDQIFIAMEYLHGRTLTAWLKDHERSWREILGVFVEAGRGLAAAHAARLIHRDFKPDNVMVGDDGRVCVVDFGLVRGEHGADLPDSRASGPASSLIEQRITRNDVIVGTPAYMSPEQHERLSIDARSDQFSYCVALWEALYGARPFAGSSRDHLAANIALRPPKPPPATAVPGYVHAALIRGLARAPERRHASMDELLDRLTPARHRAWTTSWWVVGALVLGGLALGYWTAGPAPCGPGELARQWTMSYRETLATALRRSEQPHADEFSGRAVEALDRYVDAWSAQSLDACQAHRDGRQSQRLFDLRTLCLERRLQEVTALLTTLGPDDVEQALQAISSLRAPAECAAVGTLFAEQEWLVPPPDPETAQAVEALLPDLERAHQAERLRRVDDLAHSLVTLEGSLAIRHPPFAASVFLLRSRFEDLRGRYAEAERFARLAWLSGLRGGSLAVAAEAAVLRARMQSLRLARFEAAEESLAEAEAVFGTLGDDPARTGTLAAARGTLAEARGDHSTAELWFKKALLAIERIHGGDDPRTGQAANDLAGALRRQNRLDEALPLYLRALDVAEASYGPNHPVIAVPLNNLGNVYYDLQRPADAQVYYERALRIREEALGREHPEVANVLNNLANNLIALDRAGEATALHSRALEIRERVLGPRHPDVAASLANRAMADAALGRHAEAAASLERALAIQQEALGAEHPELASTYNVLGNLHFAMGDLEAAVREYERAVKLCERSTSYDPSELAAWLFNLGNALLELHRHDEARAVLSRSLNLAERSQVSSHQVQQPLMALARLELENRRPAEALALARRALAIDDLMFTAAERAELRYVAARAAWSSGSDDRRSAEALALEALALLRGSSSGSGTAAEIEAWLRQIAITSHD